MILDEIVQATRLAVARRKKNTPFEEVIRKAERRPRPLDFAETITGQGVKIIAEVKKASPSKGVIKIDFEPVAIARSYASGGAAAISVLTEEKYFQGSLKYLESIADDLREIRPPLLCKDFIVDAYQVYEARTYGADAILLIVAILSSEELSSLLELTHRLGMTALVETHNEEEVMVAVGSGARVIGVNNRDLRTFSIDIKTTAKLRPLIPDDRLVVSESGISSRRDIEYLRNIGVNAALIGEALITATNIESSLRDLRA